MYIECYSSSWRSRSANIYQNVSFQRNTVTSNGYSGLLISLGAASDRATAGDTHIIGDVSYVGNNVSNNLYDGIYLYRYAYAGYTESTDVVLDGDVLLEGNTVNGNYGYAAFVYHWIYNSQSGPGGSSQLKADYIARNNTMSGNLNWATMYLYRYVSGYYTGLVELDSDLLVEDNTVSGNRGIGILAVDYCYQFYYGGSGVPDRGNVTQRVANGLTTNLAYDITGMVVSAYDDLGRTVCVTPMPVRVGSSEGLGVTLGAQPFLQVDSVSGAAVHVPPDLNLVVAMVVVESSCRQVVSASLNANAPGTCDHCAGLKPTQD